MTALALHLPALTIDQAGPLALLAIVIAALLAVLHDPYRGQRR